jgi:hypothetical protein
LYVGKEKARPHLAGLFQCPVEFPCARLDRVIMDAEFNVELAAGDPTLSIPWSSDDGRLRFYDLKLQPDLLLYIDEASRYPELAEFLVRINSPASVLASAKCDAWYTTELGEAEAVYGASAKFVSYVDVFFAAVEPRFSFDQHEQFARRLVKLLGRAPEISSAAEFILRRCSYQPQTGREGFYFTFYLSAYGDDEPQSRRRWGIALNLIGNAILQLSAVRPGAGAG